MSEVAGRASSSQKIELTRKGITVAIHSCHPSNAPITIHCKSEDDDLGTHAVAEADHDDFSSRVNFFGATLFFCGVSWQGGQATFDIYKASRDQRRSLDYYHWLVKVKGIEGFEESTSSTPDIVIPRS